MTAVERVGAVFLEVVAGIGATHAVHAHPGAAIPVQRALLAQLAACACTVVGTVQAIAAVRVDLARSAAGGAGAAPVHALRPDAAALAAGMADFLVLEAGRTRPVAAFQPSAARVAFEQGAGDTFEKAALSADF